MVDNGCQLMACGECDGGAVDATPPPDAGVPDAPPPPDAAVPDAPPPPDAAAEPDAPLPPDARVDAAPLPPDARVDAAPAPDAAVDARGADAKGTDPLLPTGFVEGGGCDCRAGGSAGGPSPGGLISLLGFAAALVVLRRRR